jgi:hypothetical protein
MNGVTGEFIVLGVKLKKKAGLPDLCGGRNNADRFLRRFYRFWQFVWRCGHDVDHTHRGSIYYSVYHATQTFG